MSETHIDFHYTRPDVVSAQRMRFLRSNQLKVILILWLGAMLFLIAPLVLPQVFPPGQSSSWGVVLQIAMAFSVTLFVMIFFTPWMDFYINRFWRLPLSLHFSEKFLRLVITGKTGGLHLAWKQIRRVEENDRVFILDYGEGNKYLILPKSAFTHTSDVQRFRELLTRRSMMKDEPVEET